MRKILVFLCGLAAAAGVAAMPLAQAAFPQTAVVSDNPVDWTPHVQSGRVRSLVTVDGITVAVGNFTQVSEAGSSTVLARKDIFAFDSSGHISDTFVPDVTGSELYDVIPAGDGQSVFVAGSFSRVDGLGGTNRLVKLNVHTGAVDRSFRPPSFNNRTTMLQIANGRLYVSGQFTKVGGQPHTSLTALDPQTGAETNHLNLAFGGTWNGGVMGVVEFTMTPDGSRLVAIGNFRTVEGQSRPQIAMIDTSGPVATLDSWATTRFSNTCSRTFETYMYDVDSSPDGTYFVVVTTGAYSGGPSVGSLCDATSRWEFGRSGSGQQPTWVEYSGGDTVTAVEVTGPAIYIGGHFRWTNNPFRADHAGEGAVGRKGLAALDPRNGLPFTWNPSRLRGWGVWGFRSDDQGLWIGHDTDEVGHETHKRIALMPLAGGMTPPTDATGSLPANVYLAAITGDELVANAFDGSTVTGSSDVANGGIDWSSARGAFMVGDTVYTGWADGRLTYRSYDGTRFGLTRPVNLNNLVSFASEIPNIRAMWFDRVTGRMYYTLSGSTRLYFRYFTPQSRIVGAQRFEVSTAGIDFSRVTGGFVVGDTLFYRTDSGALNKVAWQSGAGANGPSGASTSISGPSVDGRDWSSRALFLFAE
jgi:hypothetical protein